MFTSVWILPSRYRVLPSPLSAFHSRPREPAFCWSYRLRIRLSAMAAASRRVQGSSRRRLEPSPARAPTEVINSSAPASMPGKA